jgi:hypothetical protein
MRRLSSESVSPERQDRSASRTGTDALWRTVATCAVVGAGTLAFSWINGLFDPGER